MGQAAHICAASVKGPRFDSAQSEEDRQSIENGIWLCEFCATLIDKGDGADFSSGKLRTWKLASERAALDRLYRQSDAVRDNCVESLIFINIPRLHHLLAQNSQSLSLPTYFDCGIPTGRYILPELHGLYSVIGRMRFPALRWQEAAANFADPSGLLVSFEGRFWTKNGPRSPADRRETDFTDFRAAPHIYAKHMGIKLLLPYDPRFLTTNTASVEMNSGNINVAGFALLKFKNNSEIVGSPFIIGMSSTPEGRAFMDALRSHQSLS